MCSIQRVSASESSLKTEPIRMALLWGPGTECTFGVRVDLPIAQVQVTGQTTVIHPGWLPQRGFRSWRIRVQSWPAIGLKPPRSEGFALLSVSSIHRQLLSSWWGRLSSPQLTSFSFRSTVGSGPLPTVDVQLLSRVRLFATPWTAARQTSLSFTNSWSLLTLMYIKLVMPSNHLILCRPLLLLPSIFRNIRVVSNESALHISIGVSASASVLPKNIQDWFPLGWTGRISLQPKGLSRVFSNTTVQKHQFFGTQLSL